VVITHPLDLTDFLGVRSVKTALKAALWRWQDRNHKGFTLIELLVVVMISGALAAIALPSFLSQANKAKQTEAKLYVSTLNRAQQAYIMEHSQFTDNVGQLGAPLPSSSNYTYAIALGNNSDPYALNYAESQISTLRPYVGMAAIISPGAGDAITTAILCESETPSTGRAANPSYGLAAITCTPSTREIR